MRHLARAPAARTAGIVLVAFGLVGCGGGAVEEAPRADGDPTLSGDVARALERTDEVVSRSEAAKHSYEGLTLRSGQVDVSTTLPPHPRSVTPAVALCSTVVAQLDGTYRVSVRARNGRQLAFSVDGPCKRMHLKATTTLWGVAGGSSG